jgi:hypothetical protein
VRSGPSARERRTSVSRPRCTRDAAPEDGRPSARRCATPRRATARAARAVGHLHGPRTGGRYDDQTDAFYAIGCLDAPAPPTVAAVTQVAARAERAAPVFGASTVWLGLPCTFWPAKPDAKVGPIHAAGAPPIW